MESNQQPTSEGALHVEKRYALLSRKYQLATLGENFLEGLNSLPPSRAISIARTKTEEAVMWLNKNIYRNA